MKNDRILVVGSSNTDMSVRVDRLPQPGETVLGDRFVMGPGGKGANQAVAAKRLGGNVEFICKVGNDVFGDNSVKIYQAEGLDVRNVLRSDCPSGVALIPVDSNAENSIVVASGANRDFSPADIEQVRTSLETCGILVLQLEIPVESVVLAAHIAHEAGAYVILNPAPATELPAEFFADVDLFTPNETELAAFSGSVVRDVPTAERAAWKMMEKGIKNLIVTLGSKGSLVVSPEGSDIVPSKRVHAVDTTGAGDTYIGALCVALAEGNSLFTAAHFASAAAALSVQRVGAQQATPYRVEVDAS